MISLYFYLIRTENRRWKRGRNYSFK